MGGHRDRTGFSSKDYIEETERYGARNYAPLEVVISRGEGIFLYDVDGKRYFDFLSAYSAVGQGHCHPRIVDALIAQAKRLTLTSRAFYNDRAGEMLAKIADVTGFPRVLPMNTGAEAVETAIKAMRRHAYERRGVPEDQAEILVAEEAFHGRTTTIVGFSSDPAAYRFYGPATPGFRRVPFGDADAIERAIGPHTAGILLEPIQGEAGVLVPPDAYLPRVRELCSKSGALLCLDEVQTGFGRTGAMFAWQHVGARPDLIVLGKALSGGVYPVSAVAGTDEVMSVFTPGTHGSTFGGNPLAAAVAVAALEVIEDERLPERAARTGAMAIERLRRELGGVPHVKEARGRGLMMAIELRTPNAHAYAMELARRGVLAKDTHDVTLRLLPPLVIEEAAMNEALDVVIDVLRLDAAHLPHASANAPM